MAFDEKDNEGSMSNVVTLHLTPNGSYGKAKHENGPVNHPVKSEYEGNGENQSLLIGSICGALVMIAIILWAGIWYFRNQRGSFKSSQKNGIIEIGLVQDPSPPSTIQRESETLKRSLMQPQMTVIEPVDNHSTPVYWSASQLLDNNNLVLQSRGVNTTLDPISEEYTEEDLNTNEDEELYARGLANYGLQTQAQMRQLTQQLHEPIYVGYSPSPDTTTSTIYGTSRKKVPPKVPPKPSINALLGIGIVIPASPGQNSQNADIYGTTRHISHV